MKRTKIMFGLAALSIGALASAFTVKDAKSTTSYFAPANVHGIGTISNSATKNATNYPSFLNTNTAPAVGTSSGDCSSNSGFTCVAKFTVTINNTAGTYQNVWQTGEYHF